MIVKIEDRKYWYQGQDVCSISANLSIYAIDGTTLIDQRELLANFNVNEDTTNILQSINLQIGTQITEYVQKMQQIDAIRQQIYPTSTSFKDAIDLLFDPFEQSLNS